MIRLITFFIFLIFTGLSSAQDVPSHLESVAIAINHDDGGKTNQRHIRNLLEALIREGCNVTLADAATATPAQLVFDPGPVSIIKKQMTDYRLIARARTLDGDLKVRGAIVVHASKGITDLALLKDEWIAFVSNKSWPGYRLPVQLLQEAGVNERSNSFYFVGNHIGVVSALLHRDVHVAVTTESLAKRWSEQNYLSIVAVTDEVETGGWWMHRSVADSQLRNCTRSIQRLRRSQHKALPAWIDGFITSVSDKKQ